MSATQVLHGEPGHKVRSFVEELLERRGETIRSMRPALTALVIGIVGQFEAMKAEFSSIDLKQVKFAETTWTRDGQLVITMGYGTLPPFMEQRYHVDPVIEEIIEKNAKLDDLRDELAQFVAAMVDQWGMVKQREPLMILAGVSYDNFRWLDKQLVIDTRVGGQLYGWNRGSNAGARVML